MSAKHENSNFSMSNEMKMWVREERENFERENLFLWMKVASYEIIIKWKQNWALYVKKMNDKKLILDIKKKFSHSLAKKVIKG